MKLHPKGAGGGLCLSQQPGSGPTSWISKKRHMDKFGEGLLQQLKLFAADLNTGQQTQPGDIPAGMREAIDEPGTNRVGSCRYNDQDVACRILSGKRRRRIRRKDDINLETKQLASQVRKTGILSLAITVLNSNVLALHIAKRPETLPKCVDVHSKGSSGSWS